MQAICCKLVFTLIPVRREMRGIMFNRTDPILLPWEVVLEQSEASIFSKTLDNIIRMWGSGAERVYGCTYEEMVAHSVERLLPPGRAGDAGNLIYAAATRATVITSAVVILAQGASA